MAQSSTALRIHRDWRLYCQVSSVVGCFPDKFLLKDCVQELRYSLYANVYANLQVLLESFLCGLCLGWYKDEMATTSVFGAIVID